MTDLMDLTSVGDRADQFFAGRRFTGVCMIAAPLLLTAGAVFQDAEATPNIVNLAGPALLVGFVLLAIGTAKAGVLSR